MESRFAGRAPHVVYGETEKGDWWYADGVRLFSGLGGADTGVRFWDPEKLRNEARMEEVQPGGYLPEVKIADMDVEEIYGQVLYPTIGMLVYWLYESDLLSAICRAYNDWAAEFCEEYPNRIKAVAMINHDDVGEGIKELERGAKLGLKGAMISVCPWEDRAYDKPVYERFWAAAQDLDMPCTSGPIEGCRGATPRRVT